jgi:DNA repair ATPase RecN
LQPSVGYFNPTFAYVLIMPDGPINITTDILIAIREDISSFRTSVEGRLDRVEGRLDRLEQISRKYRRDAAAMMVIMRATAGDFDERVSAVEERVMALEGPKG